jgi:glycosyltransferase involved in cell wall biosynthesis
VRIAIVGTDLSALDRRGGGLEQVVLRWAGAMAVDHEVVLVSHAPAERPLDLSGVDGEVVVVGRTADLGSALRRLDPDVVSLHNRPHWVRHCPDRSRVAVTFHNYPQAWRVPARSWPATRVAAGGRLALSAVSHALAAAAATTLGVAPDRVAVTPPAIDPAFVDPPPRPATRPRVVLSPNRLLRKKGVLDLLAVARREAFRDVEFAFADLISPWPVPTAEHRALRAAIARVSNATLFEPAAAPAALASRYVASGAVACAVREPEGLGLVALEAQACRAPLVTTDSGGLREATFSPNRCIPPHDHDALDDALAAALSVPSDDEGPRRCVLARHTPSVAGVLFLRWVAETVR